MYQLAERASLQKDITDLTGTEVSDDPQVRDFRSSIVKTAARLMAPTDKDQPMQVYTQLTGLPNEDETKTPGIHINDPLPDHLDKGAVNAWWDENGDELASQIHTLALRSSTEGLTRAITSEPFDKTAAAIAMIDILDILNEINEYQIFHFHFDRDKLRQHLYELGLEDGPHYVPGLQKLRESAEEFEEIYTASCKPGGSFYWQKVLYLPHTGGEIRLTIDTTIEGERTIRLLNNNRGYLQDTITRYNEIAQEIAF